MTVEELIEKLQALPKEQREKRVCIEFKNDECVAAAENVSAVKAYANFVAVTGTSY